jgi:hypothetical protein
MMLASVGSDLDHVIHVSVSLKQMSDFDAIRRLRRVARRPPPGQDGDRVSELPKPGLLVTMGLIAVTSD